jgi:hypothetical protein
MIAYTLQERDIVLVLRNGSGSLLGLLLLPLAACSLELGFGLWDFGCLGGVGFGIGISNSVSGGFALLSSDWFRLVRFYLHDSLLARAVQSFKARNKETVRLVLWQASDDARCEFCKSVSVPVDTYRDSPSSPFISSGRPRLCHLPSTSSLGLKVHPLVLASFEARAFMTTCSSSSGWMEHVE